MSESPEKLLQAPFRPSEDKRSGPVPETSSEKPRGRVTPKQWLTMGVLAILFVGVLVSQFAGASPKPIASTTGSPSRARRPIAAGATTDNPAASGSRTPIPDHPKDDHPWPGFPLAKVLEFDPFATPASLAAGSDEALPRGRAEKLALQKSAAAEKDRAAAEKAAMQKAEDAEKDRAKHQQALAKLKQETVRAIVGTERGFAAIVGTRTVHVGDRLHGFLVKEIRADGVILEDSHD